MKENKEVNLLGSKPSGTTCMELKPAFAVHSKTNDTSVRVLLNGVHNLFKRSSFPGKFPQLFLKLELQYKQARL